MTRMYFHKNEYSRKRIYFEQEDLFYMLEIFNIIDINSYRKGMRAVRKMKNGY